MLIIQDADLSSSFHTIKKAGRAHFTVPTSIIGLLSADKRFAVKLRREVGADNGGRTRDTKLGKLVLYQLSYARSTKVL